MHRVLSWAMARPSAADGWLAGTGRCLRPSKGRAGSAGLPAALAPVPRVRRGTGNGDAAACLVRPHALTAPAATDPPAPDSCASPKSRLVTPFPSRVPCPTSAWNALPVPRLPSGSFPSVTSSHLGRRRPADTASGPAAWMAPGRITCERPCRCQRLLVGRRAHLMEPGGMMTRASAIGSGCCSHRAGSNLGCAAPNGDPESGSSSGSPPRTGWR
jgi:hypothetical protein